jgi:hypothetical protein
MEAPEIYRVFYGNESYRERRGWIVICNGMGAVFRPGYPRVEIACRDELNNILRLAKPPKVGYGPWVERTA